jgi:hypothetical protein
MSKLPTDLDRLGDALERTTAADLSGEATAPAPRRRFSRRLVLAGVAAAILIPSVALAANALISTEEVGQSMPAGALELAGTNPTCTVVKENVEYHCVLESAPGTSISDYKGTVYQTVDDTSHVNGGCRSLRSDGMEWQCYIGEEAVRQQIIGPDFLGELQTAPAVG